MYKNQNVSNTSIAEAFERNASLFSFIPSDFKEKQIEVSKENQSKNLINFSDKKHLLETLYENKLLNFHQFCLIYFKGSKLNFEKVNLKESFESIDNETIENDFYNSFIVFDKMDWSDIVSQPKKKGFDYKRYESANKQNKLHFSKYSFDIYKFRASQKFRVFGYREKDIFYVLEIDTTHKRSD